MIPDGAIISGIISKIINDLVDVSKDKIKKADQNRKTKNQSFETRIYQVIIDAINEFTDKRYKNQDILYDTAEKMLNGFKNGKVEKIEVVASGLRILDSYIDNDRCERFIGVLDYEISKENNFDVYKEILLLLLGQATKYSHDELQQIKEQLVRITEKLDENNRDSSFEGLPSEIYSKVKSRTQEYLDKWNANMFLNDFSEWDENAGANVKLKDVYIEAHLPHFIWGVNKKVYTNLKTLLSQHVENKDGNKMLLILGQPGIGKSTLITWITANFSGRVDDILVYQFASDLKNIDWLNNNIFEKILSTLNLSNCDLNGKTLILDGFDEVNAGDNRKGILDNIFVHFLHEKKIKNLSLIITCRENYFQKTDSLKCQFITLQPWDEIQIESFFKIYQTQTNHFLTYKITDNIMSKKKIFGIPLILYMILALNIYISKESSVVDVYDQIFSLKEGGIYERCIKNNSYETPHRISEIEEQVHQISKEIAIWMFENKPSEAYIPYDEYIKICDHVMKEQRQENESIRQDFLIGNYFKQVKYCEGLETEKLYFVHRSIYEYFVAETIYHSIENTILVFSDESQEDLARKIAFCFKQGRITPVIGEYLQYKILKLYDKLDRKKRKNFYQFWEGTVIKMMNVGMFYFTKKNIQNFCNIMSKESICFINLINTLRMLQCLNNKKYIMENADNRIFKKYIKYYLIECEINKQICDLRNLYLEKFKLQGRILLKANLEDTNLIKADLRDANLLGANLRGADLRGANLQGADLRGVNLQGADLRVANLQGADLQGADLRGADLRDVYLVRADLESSIWFKVDIKELFWQLTETKFTYIMTEEHGERKRVYRGDLFPNEK